MEIATYLVERYLPGYPPEQLGAALERIKLVSERMSEEGIPIRYLGSLFIPTEESCFCRFEAGDAEWVAEANARAAVPFARISAAVPLPGDR